MADNLRYQLFLHTVKKGKAQTGAHIANREASLGLRKNRYRPGMVL